MTAAVDEARARIPLVHVAMEHDWPDRGRRRGPGMPFVTVDDDASRRATTTAHRALLA